MSFAEFLYQLTPRDTGAPVIEQFFWRRTLFTASVGLTTEPVSIPSGKVGVIGGFSLEALAGAATNVNQLGAVITPRGQPSVVLQKVFDTGTIVVASPLLAVANVPEVGNLFIDPFIADLVFTAAFSSGAAPNSLNASVWGWLVPLGTLQTTLLRQS